MSPALSRREFLKQSGMIAAVAGAVPASAAPFLHQAMAQSLPRDGGRLRVLLFHDPNFPFIDCETVSAAMLQSALQGCVLRVADADGLSAALQQDDIDLLVTAHGSAFPEDAGMPLLGCLARGVNWLQLGGVPLAVPVRRAGDAWHAAPRRTRWHRKLGLTQAFAVDCRQVDRWTAPEGYTELRESAQEIACDTAFALYWRLTSTKYFAQEDGSAGTRDAMLLPLVSGELADGTSTVAAVQQLDWLHGDTAGSRWILYTGDRALPAQSIAQLAAYAGCGAAHLTVAPGYARYRAGEAPSLSVRLHRPRSAGDGACVVEILRDGAVLKSVETALHWSEALALAQAEVPLESRDLDPRDGGPQFYEIRAHCTLPCAAGVSVLEANSGFWIARDEDLERDAPLGASGTELTRGGNPLSVAGTTYMAGDVQRNFLLEPNPWIWRRDFTAMREAGINLVRTGIWYGWKRIMLEPGRLDEAVLRAMDAFLLVAHETDIPVIFTFFTFLPDSWGGENPYLDPRAVAAQQAFVGAFARRYAGVHGLIWDLINEPSFSSPAQLWRCRPNYDRFELAAWQEWLRGRLPGMDDASRLRLLADRWRGDSAETASLPALTDFDDGNLFSDRQPLKVLDYRLFAQHAFADWVRKLGSAIRAVDRPDRMLMVGQDEGGTMDRPHPQFFADAVDISSVHSWWFNDDLLWDSVVTRAPGIPHLVQETGAMFHETAEGGPWRGEEEAARLIQRKLAIAAGAGSAGFVHWLWNSNPYMPSDNEAAIGALRADGSAKPEFAVLRGMARFLKEAAPSLRGRKEEDVVMVLPHTDQFSVRGNGMRATRQCVRTLAYRCRLQLRAVSEYALDRDTETARLYVLPSPALLTESAWQTLLERVRTGATLLVTGVIDRDDAWQAAARSALFDVETEIRPVSPTELLSVADRIIPCGYRGEDLQRVERAVVRGGGATSLLEAKHGKGRVLWCPLPVEMCDNTDAIVAVYRAAMLTAKIESDCLVRPDHPGVLVYTSRFREAVLVTVISEQSDTTELRIALRQPESELELSLRGGEAVLLLLDRRGREILRSRAD